MGIFDDLKYSLGISNMSKTKGNILGGGQSKAELSSHSTEAGNSATDAHHVYSVAFTEPTMGIRIASMPNTDAPMVGEVFADSYAQRAGVQKDDLIVQVDGNRVDTCDVFLQILEAIGRPVTITFSRDSSAASRQPSSSRSNNQSASASLLSDREKDERRSAMENAARAREQQWDKKVAAGSRRRKEGDTQIGTDGRTIYDHSALAAIGSSNPETQRMVNLAKQAEDRSRERLGYDVFKPHMSSSSRVGRSSSSSDVPSATSTSSTASASPRTTGGTGTGGGGRGTGGGMGVGKSSTDSLSGQAVQQDSAQEALRKEEEDFLLMSSRLQEGEECEGAVEGVDSAMSLLLGCNPDDGPKVQLALTTVMKMLCALSNADSENNVKFRSIRVMNPSFQSKVVAVNGGVQMMEAAGFVLTAEGDGREEIEQYLRHPMDERACTLLNYTIARLQELDL